MQNAASCHTVADYFLMQLDQNVGDSITNLKLQKLVYYAQAWHLAIFGKMFFSDRIEAWAHGPVIPVLYRRFRDYKWNAIEVSDVQSNPYEELHPNDLAFLDQVWSTYGGHTAKQLERLTHSEEPWIEAYGDTLPGGACETEIDVDTMRRFYGGRLKAA